MISQRSGISRATWERPRKMTYGPSGAPQHHQSIAPSIRWRPGVSYSSLPLQIGHSGRRQSPAKRGKLTQPKAHGQKHPVTPPNIAEQRPKVCRTRLEVQARGPTTCAHSVDDSLSWARLPEVFERHVTSWRVVLEPTLWAPKSIEWH